MSSILFFVILAINVAISFWNARICGLVWEDAKREGGFTIVLAWCGLIQSAIGFSMIFIFAEAMIAAGFGKPKIANAMMGLWYIAIIVPAIGTGLIITVHSVMEAWKRRDFSSVATAAWNVGATAHNLYEAPSSISAAWDMLSSVTSSSSDDEDASPLAQLIGPLIALAVALSIATGSIVTYMVFARYRALARALPQEA